MCWCTPSIRTPNCGKIGCVPPSKAAGKPDLATLHAELAAAIEEHEAAARREECARSDTTRALNRLNAAQKAIDAAVAEMRKSAPLGSDWTRR